MTTIEDAAAAVRDTGGELRAYGTDIMTRAARPGRPARHPALRGITWRPDGSARIGALTTIADLLADDRLTAAYPALAATAAAVATPQIRNVATVGGNLLQRNRCWYPRNSLTCHQTGGDTCPARDGAHLYSAVIDQGPASPPSVLTRRGPPHLRRHRRSARPGRAGRRRPVRRRHRPDTRPPPRPHRDPPGRPPTGSHTRTSRLPPRHRPRNGGMAPRRSRRPPDLRRRNHNHRRRGCRRSGPHPSSPPRSG